MNQLQVIENKWLHQLIEFNKVHFKNSKVISHNEAHHLRVWNYCKQLYSSISALFPNINLEVLLFSSMFHDTGLEVSNSFDHGKYSKKIFLQFCRQNHIHLHQEQQIAHIIEFHDDKEYKENIERSIEFSILTIADDMDAFGTIGIYRYLEIYLMRSIPKEELAYRILSNLESRFNYLKLFLKGKTMLKEWDDKFKITSNFFNDLINHKKYSLEILNLIEETVIKRNETIFDLLKKTDIICNESESIIFFDQLKKDLNYEN